MQMRLLRMVAVGAPLLLAAGAAWRAPEDASRPSATSARYSPLAQITKANVSRLTVAWTYRVDDAGRRRRRRSSARRS